MKNLLYIDSCVLRETSRTKKIGDALVKQLAEARDCSVTELVLEDLGLTPFTSPTLTKRNEIIAKNQYDDPMFDLAHQFAEADIIVMAAPFWEGGYPSLLKLYLEHVSVTGIVNHYTEHGPVGSCKATELYYVTTRGGFATDEQDMGWQNIKGLAKVYGIEKADCISVKATDIPTTNIDEAIEQAIASIPTHIAE